MGKSLAVALAKSIGQDITSIAGGLLEVGIDAVCNDGLLRDIPFVSTVASIFNIGKSISDMHNISKLASFVEQINQSIADKGNIEQYKIMFETQEKVRTQELTYLLIIIDRYIGVERPRMLAKLYLAYLRGEISWEELVSYAEVVDRLLPYDYKLLSESDIVSVDYKDVNSGYLRLTSLGLMVDYGSGTGINMSQITVLKAKKLNYILTAFGEKLKAILAGE